MRIILTAAILFAFIQLGKAQVTIDGKNLNEDPDIKIIGVIVQGKAFSSNEKIIIDYGQKINLLGKATIITDGKGRQRNFKSLLKVWNFLEANGWQFVTTSNIVSGQYEVERLIFRKVE